MSPSAKGNKPLLFRTRLSADQWEKSVERIVSDASLTAAGLQKLLALGSYRTAWRMARLIHEAMNRVEWPVLHGEVEVCEAMIGARYARFWVLAERHPAGHLGAIRTLRAGQSIGNDLDELVPLIEPGSTVVTSKLATFARLEALGFHRRCEETDKEGLLPSTQSVVSAIRTMLQARHHLGVTPRWAHLWAAEYCFRHNAAYSDLGLPDQRALVLKALHTGI